MNPLEVMWKDTMDIYRFVEVVEDGFTRVKEQLIHEGVKCHYSKGNLVDVGEGVPTLSNSHNLFCSIDTDLIEGDRIVVTQRNGKQIELSVGEGFPYTYHQEFEVRRDDTA